MRIEWARAGCRIRNDPLLGSSLAFHLLTPNRTAPIQRELDSRQELGGSHSLRDSSRAILSGFESENPSKYARPRCHQPRWENPRECRISKRVHLQRLKNIVIHNIVSRKLSRRSEVLETCAKNLSSDEGRIDGQTKWVSSVARSPTPAQAGPTWVQATTLSHKINVLLVP